MVKRFLIADDDPDDVDLFLEALSEIDTSIVCSSMKDGKELLDTLVHQQTESPDVIFLDINMPEMNGWECLQQLKHNHHATDIPVIMYSTSSAQKDVQKAIESGALAFYEKPSNFSQLKEFLDVIAKSQSLEKEVIASQLRSRSKSHRFYI
jgi:CheY-like chemotaxis protein